MVTSLWLVTITLLLTWSQVNAQNYYLLPERDARFVSSGDSDSTVIQPGDSLYDALRGLKSDSTLVLSSGQYQLEQYVLVSNLNDVQIYGHEDVVISCNENVGLVFVNVSGLVIDNVHIEGCGLSGTNLDHALTEIHQFIDLFVKIYPSMRVAVLLAHCENLQINKVELNNNDGFGFVGVNIIGTSVISQLTAFNNTQPSDCYTFPDDPDRYGGGVVLIYQDYLSEYQELYSDQFYQLTIEDGLLMNNTECSFHYRVYTDYNEPEYLRNFGLLVGGGGGTTFIMAQLNFGIEITVKNTSFIQNTARIGSGAHVTMLSGTKNTAIKFVNCHFKSNGLPPEATTNIYVLSGAGLGIITDFRRPSNEQYTPPHVAHYRNTSIQVQDSQFLENIAPRGGGIYYNSIYKYAVSDLTDVVYFYIWNCTFLNNLAFTGSAILMSEFKYHAAFAGTQLEVIDTNVMGNIIVSNSNGAQSVQQNSGIIDLRNMNMTFKGNCAINKNSGSGLKAESSYIGIDGNITFSENIGVRGGAMFLTTFTWLIVLPNASLYLLNNTAREEGGAIYSNFPDFNSINGVRSFPNCFLTFSFDTIGPCINCSNLNKSGSFIKFEGNFAPAGSQVFGSSFDTCSWAIQLRPLQPNKWTVLADEFPNVFSFDTPTIGPEYFKTQAQTLNAVGPNGMTEFNVLPGQVFSVIFTARDSFNQIVSTIVSSFIETKSQGLITGTSTIGANNLGLLKNNKPTELPMSVTGKEGQVRLVVLYSNDLFGAAHTEISVNLRQCGLGYVFDPDSLSCVCDPELEKLGVTCDAESLDLVKTRDNFWIGPVDGNTSLGVVSCPLYCATSTNNTIPLKEGKPNFDIQCDPELYRTGVACGDCQKGRSLVLGSSKCSVCSNVYILLFLVFIALGILLTFIIYYINITLTSGLLNGAIFFSNVVTLYGDFLFPRVAGYNNHVATVSFLSLNFGFEVCLYEGMGAVDRLWWQLSFPLYLFGLIILVIFLAKFKTLKGIKNPKVSFVRAISTLLLLCYVSILQFVAQLFVPTTINTTDQGKELRWIIQPSLKIDGGHIFLVILAIILTLFYLLPLPFLLILSKVIFMSKHLNKFKPVYDSLWHPFEPKYRWWLGFRLMFRWLPFFFIFAPIPINLFLTDLALLVLLCAQLLLKPFKNFWINLLDSAFIFMLVVMFTGTQFFIANEKKNNIDSDIEILFYNFTLSFLALCIIVGIFVYHLLIRFQTLKACVLEAWSKIRSLLLKKKSTSQENNTKSSERNAGATFSEVVASVQLREPSLEDSFIMVVPKTPKE